MAEVVNLASWLGVRARDPDGSAQVPGLVAPSACEKQAPGHGVAGISSGGSHLLTVSGPRDTGQVAGGQVSLGRLSAGRVVFGAEMIVPRGRCCPC